MIYNSNLVSFGALASALLTGILAAVGLTRRKVRAALPFSALMASLTIYSFGTAFEYRSISEAGAFAWTHVEYLGIAFIPASLVLFAVEFASFTLPARRAFAMVVLALSVLILVAQETTEITHLFYRNLRLAGRGALHILDFDSGPFYVIFEVYLGSSLLFAMYLMARRAALSSGFRRMQRVMVGLGVAIGAFGFALRVGGVVRYGVDLGPLFTIASALLLAYGLLRYRMLNFVPLAHVRAFEAMREGGIILDDEERLIDFNAAAAGIFPQLAESKLGEPVGAVLPPESPLIGLIRGGTKESAEILIDFEGIERWYDVSLSRVSSRRDRTLGRVIILNDVTQQHELARELREQAIRDPLTELYSRRHFFEMAGFELEQARRHRRPVALIMLDLDHFKRVNDTFGHQAGDAVLVETAARCRESIRLSDLICRYGGEEFLILLPESGIEAARLTAERIRAAIASEPIEFGEIEIRVTGSFGVSALDVVSSESMRDLVREADEALYRAKQAGRDRVELSGASVNEKEE